MSPVAAKTPRNPSTEIVYDQLGGRLIRSANRLPLSWDEWNALASSERAAALRGVPAARRVHVVEEIEARGRKQIGEPAHVVTRRFRIAATAARADLSGTQPDAARVFAEAIARRTGGKALGAIARDLRYQGRGVSRLPELLTAGGLTAGMVVQLVPSARATQPGTRTAATHWLTYLGRDTDGIARFADLQRDGWSLGALLTAFAGWSIDGVLDPHASTRR